MISDEEKQPYRMKHKKMLWWDVWKSNVTENYVTDHLPPRSTTNTTSEWTFLPSHLSTFFFTCFMFNLRYYFLLAAHFSATYELLHKVSLAKLVEFITIMEITVFLSTTLLLVLRLFPRLLLTIPQLILLEEDSSQAFHLPDTWVRITTWWTTPVTIFRCFIPVVCTIVSKYYISQTQ